MSEESPFNKITRECGAHYIRVNDKVLKCRLHNQVEIPMKTVYNGGDCTLCSKNRIWTRKFIKEMKKKFVGLVYDATIFRDIDTNIKVRCAKHGIIIMTPRKFLSRASYPCDNCNYPVIELPIMVPKSVSGKRVAHKPKTPLSKRLRRVSDVSISVCYKCDNKIDDHKQKKIKEMHYKLKSRLGATVFGIIFPLGIQWNSDLYEALNDDNID